MQINNQNPHLKKKRKQILINKSYQKIGKLQ